MSLPGSLATGTELGGYAILEPIGRGGMGVVYLAEDRSLGRRVALKVLAPDLVHDPVFRARFESESRTAASIDHPNVVPVFQAGEADGLLYLAMRYVDGPDLRAVIATERRLPASRAAAIVGQLGEALDAAHARGLVHRDVKPANALLAEGDHAYLTDFGLTRHVTSGGGLTATGQWVGTVDYIAPEQIPGGAIDARADIYSLGCVLFECLTGHVPFPREAEMAKLYAHVEAPAPSARKLEADVPPALDAVVQRALSKEPADRYPSAGDLGRAALAGARGSNAGQPERSVAVGRAAPVAVMPASAARTRPERSSARDERPTPRIARTPAPRPVPVPPVRAETPPPAAPSGRRMGRAATALAIVIAAALLAGGGVAAALILSNGGSKHQAAARPPSKTPSAGGGGTTETDTITRETSSSSFTTYDRPAYSADVPAGWVVRTDYERKNNDGHERRVSNFNNPDNSSSITIDTTLNSVPTDPMRSVRVLEGGVINAGGSTVNINRTTVNGSPAVDWIYDSADGERKSDLFFWIGDEGFAVLTSADRSDFSSAHKVGRQVAESIQTKTPGD